jgi:hypothetical protein
LLVPLSSFSLSNPEKEAVAVKTNQLIKIDGKLDEPAWQQAPVSTDFIVNSPSFGASSSQKTEVKIIYNDQAVYIGVYLYDDPALIRRQLTSRDGEQRQDVDYFAVFFDTYNDDQNGFEFVVTSRNVQSDGRLSANISSQFGAPSDYSWDAVWESRVTLRPDGWMVEMKIPYSAIRFAKKEVQDWGVNFQRYIRRNNESSYWNVIDPNQNGFVNQFGKLTGIKDVAPPIRLSFLPYITSGIRTVPASNGRKNTFLRNGGVDIKYGVNESFTLDMTLVPDFGQTISDNVVLNLSPYEVQFAENRPFFTEGTELFNKAGLFYSRRVGSTPSGYYAARGMANDSIHIISNPGVTQLYNATKFSGRTKKKLGIGIFNAIGAPMHAILENSKNGQRQQIETEPLTNYNVLVLDQSLSKRSYISFTNTSVIRNGKARDANVSGLDLALYDKKNQFRFINQFRYSKIFGNLPYDGFKNSISYGKVSGHWQYSIGNNIESDKYDPNDLGFLSAPNKINTQVSLNYNVFTPTANYLSHSYSVSVTHNSLYKPARFTSLSISAKAFFFFKNFWDCALSFNTIPMWSNDFFELRTPGKVLKRPGYWLVSLNGSTDSRKRLYGRWNFGFAESHLPNDPYHYIQGGLRYRFSDHFSLDLDMQRMHDNGQYGFTGRENNGDPILGRRNVTNFTTILAGIYNFTPRMNLSLRMRHYWSQVKYVSYYNTDAEGFYVDRPFVDGNDKNFNVFNIDMFYTWDFKYGSRLVLGWKNWLADDFPVDGTSYKTYFSNLGRVIQNPHANELTVRLIYYLDYLSLRKKKILR